jgi:hypothetical protein
LRVGRYGVDLVGQAQTSADDRGRADHRRLSRWSNSSEHRICRILRGLLHRPCCTPTAPTVARFAHGVGRTEAESLPERRKPALSLRQPVPSTMPNDEAEVPAVKRFAWSGLRIGAQSGIGLQVARCRRVMSDISVGFKSSWAVRRTQST